MVSSNKRYANETLDDIECYKAVLDGRIKQFPKGFWTKPWSLQSAAVITRYLLEESLKYTEEDIKTKVGIKTFKDNKLASFERVFNSSSYNIIDNAYPNKFKPWELKSVSSGYWDSEENVKEVVRWLVEEKLDNNKDRVCKEFNTDLLIKYRLGALRDYGIYNMLNMTYPNEFKPWDLIAVSPSFWDDRNNIREAVRWLVETKLDNNRDRVCEEFTIRLIKRHGMRGLLKMNLYEIIDIAYPGEFKPSDFKYSKFMK